MNIDWFDVHRIITREAQAEFARVHGACHVPGTGAFGLRIANRVCASLESIQRHGNEDGEEHGGVDQEQQQPDRPQVPTDG